jgi:hypothetical protein
MMSLDMLHELTRLLQLEADALTAYGAAAARVPPGAVRDELALFKVEHQRHALALHEAFLRLGRTPPEVRPDVKGVVIGAITPPRARLSETEILEAVRGNEQLSNSLYAKALARPFPAELRAVLEWAQAEERRHLEWVERALSRRGAWSGDAARP